MRILLFHPVLLPPKNYGGTERVVLWLARALRALSHEVSVVCLKGSRLPEGVHSVFVGSGEETRPEHFFSQVMTAKKLKEYDLVHFMAPPAQGFIDSFSAPYLVTVHGNGKPGEKFPKNTVFLSEDHARRHGRDSFVYNGIDPSEAIYKEKKKSNYIFLSKTSWKVKNLKGAMDIADGVGFPLFIAGGYRPATLLIRSFFSSHTWVGPVSGEEKAELLADARGLIFPILWDEPFGLVVIESLISGSPVFGPARGSLPELIPSPVGVLYSKTASLEEQCAHFQEMEQKSSRDCQEWVLSRFTHLHMGRNYVKFYEKVLNGTFLP